MEVVCEERLTVVFRNQLVGLFAGEEEGLDRSGARMYSFRGEGIASCVWRGEEYDLWL